jgi:trimethylamine:corrinoid methyltransferase-like protein
VGPAGHFLAQKHTRQHMRQAMKPAITQMAGEGAKYLEPRQAARAKLEWILKNHQPEPLEVAKRAELERILAAADKELG